MTLPNVDDSLYNDSIETDESIKLLPQKKKVTTSRNPRHSYEYQVFHDAYRMQCATRQQPDGTRGDPCVRCTEAIEYNLQYPNPRSWSLEHLIPLSERPELLLEKNNCASSHLICNTAAGNAEIENELGSPSEVW